jgi:Dyp-type peroxidase family
MEDDRLSAEAKADIQGLITSGYAHLPCAAYLFLSFRLAAPSRRWLNDLLPTITTAASWRTHPDTDKQKPPRTANIALTFSGLQSIGLSHDALCTFPPEFREGMASPDRSRILGDTEKSASQYWEFGNDITPALHAMLVLHAASKEELEKWRGMHRSIIRQSGDGVVELDQIAQEGKRPAHGKEPFGFRDGIAQPQLAGIKGEGVSTGEFVLGYRNEYNIIPPNPVVKAEEDAQRILPPFRNHHHAHTAYRDLGLNGSYLVYRKLHQDVAGFWRFMQAEAVRSNGKADPKFMIWLAAKMVGRWPGGAPLTLSPEHDNLNLGKSDAFLYAEHDPTGRACPFGSHIRRTNPRDMIRPAPPRESLHMSARHRILRRGTPYGPDLFDLTLLDNPDDEERAKTILNVRDDGEPRGLHFLCVNASIKSQFEFIQQAWANNPRFHGLTKNRDPLIGENGKADSSMLVPLQTGAIRTADLPRFVTVKGGAYFFLPGLHALRFLAHPKP